MVRRAFTLVELLVVIAIIALLLSLLAPTLSRAKSITRSVTCRSNLHQIQVAMLGYVQNYKGGIFVYNLTFDTFWVNHLRRFYSAVDSLRFCPNATQEGGGLGSWRTAWTGKYSPGSWMNNGTRYINGSYALNGWLHPGNQTYFFGDAQYIQRTAMVPAFLDSNWVDGWPAETDTMPPDLLGTTTVPNICRFAIIRHGYSINAVFFDGRADNVRLNNLFDIQWHRSFPVGSPLVLPPYTGAD